MPDATQYTLDLFNSSALGWTIPVPSVVSGEEAPEQEAEPAADAAAAPSGTNYALLGDRRLARGWPARAHDNMAAISLSKQLKQERRPATPADQEQLLRLIGFGATELAQNAFPLPGTNELRPGWEDIVQSLRAATMDAEYASLQRSTQYAHYTPEPVIRAIWRAAERLGLTGGRVREPGIGTGLFFALMPDGAAGHDAADRDRIRSDHRPNCPADPPRGEDPL